MNEGCLVKKRKISVMGIVGALLIVIGVGMISNHLVSTYLENKAIDDKFNSFIDQSTAGINPVEQVNDDEFFGVIEMPTISAKTPIVQSSNWDYLAQYAVAWDNQTLDKGNFSIAGHNGECAACRFRDVAELENGDEIIITTKDKVYIYEVYKNFNVHFTDVSVLENSDKTEITLVSCLEAYTDSPYRVIIKAELKDAKDRL